MMTDMTRTTGANVIVLGRDQVALDATKEAMQKQFVKDDQVCQAESLDLADPSAVSTIICT